MYGDVNKPELKPFENAERLILSSLSFEDQMTFQDTRKQLERYKKEVTDLEKKDFFSQNKTREKIFEFGNRLTREKGIIVNKNILFSLLQHILEGVTLPENIDGYTFDTDDGYVAESIKREFAVPNKK